MDPTLANRTVRLEAPDDLDGAWEGPVYATLGRRSKLLQPTDHGPFVAADDGVRRPAWQETLTILRHDQRYEDLPLALQEHVDVEYWIPHWRLTQPHRDLSAELLERPLLSVFRFVRFDVFYVGSSDSDTKFVRRTSDVPVLGQVVVLSPDDVSVNHISCLEFILGYRGSTTIGFRADLASVRIF
ncbi:uncharacterized protein IUM83_17149 [Phytophthora cinnamomi]|uniref:uncharacterized protein n=1 Tax=Phytophthora cinnamomi TaxID=4785 RepID=UPI003559CE25|nr:hypothetical protein IUM83_17149 [Phytophthora cinnamomi]